MAHPTMDSEILFFKFTVQVYTAGIVYLTIFPMTIIY